MAKETERFEDTRQLNGTYYPYHSLIKYEFLDDSMFSEEENYSFIANINEDAVKETMPFERIFEDSRFDNLHDIYQTTPGELSPISNYTVDSDSCDKMLSFHISNPWTVCDESNASPTICSTKDNSSDKENNEVCHLQNDEDNLTHRSNSRKVSFDEVFEYLKGKTGTEESHNDYDNNGNKKASDSFESSLIDSNGHLGIDLKYNNTGHERKKIRVKSKSKKAKGKDCIQDNRENFKPNILRDPLKSKISSEKIPKNASNSLNDNTNNSYGRIIPESECNMMHQEVLEESIVHEEFIYQNITLSAGESLETYDQSIQISQFGSDNPVQTEVPLLKEAENGKSVENMLSTVIPALQYFDKTNDITQKEIEKCVDSTVQIDNVENMLNTEIPALHYFDKINDTRLKEIEKCVDSTVQMDDVENMLNTEIPSVQYFDKINDTSFKEIEKCLDNTVQIDNVENMLNTEIPAFQYFDKINDTSLKEIEKCLDNTVQFDDVLLKKNPSLKPVRKVNRRKKSTADDDIEIKEEGLCSFLLDEQEETVVEKEKTNKIKRDSSSEEDEESDELDDEEDTRNVTSDTKFPCRLCSQEFGTKKQRKKHERKDHETRGVFSCDLCSYTSTRKYYLVKHKSRHIKEYTVFCKKCQLGFLSKNELNVHNIKQHDAQPHTCPVCKKIFVNKFNLTTHKKLHLPMNRNHQCDTCGKSFTGNNHLKRHIYSVHLKRGAQCKICLKVLNSQEALYAHNRIHNDERPFVCPTCGKASRTSSALVVHLRTHTGEKPYKCEFCGKGFTQTSSLAVHRRIHTGQRPHACHLCPDKFVTKSLLNHHMSSRHRDAIHHLEPTPNMPL
ncbi:hypothetical protein M8J76_001351 [Diaphorina citri]|nr:hypothetical protein M8J76_001351 [Diaphorina citri]